MPVAEREGIDEGIAAIARLEFRLSAEVGDAEAVAVAGDAGDHAFDDGVISADELFGDAAIGGKRAEAQ